MYLKRSLKKSATMALDLVKSLIHTISSPETHVLTYQVICDLANYPSMTSRTIRLD